MAAACRASRVVGLAVALGALAAASPAMDRYADVRRGIEKGPKMQLVAATFFGSAGSSAVRRMRDGSLVTSGRASPPNYGPGILDFPRTQATMFLPAALPAAGANEC